MRKLHPLDTAAQDRATSCIRLAYHLASKYSRTTGVALERVQDVAVDGLLHAAVRYDPQRGANFCTFAHLCIRRRIAHLITRQVHEGNRPKMIPFSVLDGRDADAGFDPGGMAGNDGDRMDARAALERVKTILPPRLFLAAWLYFAEGLTLVEVGQLLGSIGKQTTSRLVMTALRLARRRCRP